MIYKNKQKEFHYKEIMRKKITYLAGAMTIVLLIAVIKHETEVKGDEQFRYLDSIASKQP